MTERLTPDERATKLEHDIMEAVYVTADESRLVGDVRHELIARAIQEATDDAYERACKAVCSICAEGTPLDSEKKGMHVKRPSKDISRHSCGAYPIHLLKSQPHTKTE